MYETAGELADLQDLLDRSIASAGAHLTSIVEPGRRTMTAADLVERTRGICVLGVATTTRHGEPRLSAVDGHLLHGHWCFTTSGAAAKARQLRARPAVSVAWTPRDGLGVWAHGRAVFLDPGAPEGREMDDHLKLMYEQSPTEWGPDIVFLRVDPHWMIGFAMTEAETAQMAQVAARRAERLGNRAGADPPAP